MKTILLLLSVWTLASCGNGSTSNESDDIEERPERSITNEAPRIIAPIDFVEYLDNHDEAEVSDKENLVEPENINFDLTVERDTETGISDNKIILHIKVETEEELVLGSTHFRIEYYNGENWEEIENAPYGAEDAEIIVTSEEPYEYTFNNIDQYDTEFNNGIYRMVNSGYIFPFYVYVLEGNL